MADSTTKIVSLGNLETYTTEVKKIIPSVKYITEEDYDKLSDTDKMNGTYYFVDGGSGAGQSTPKQLKNNEFSIPTTAWTDSTQDTKYTKEAKITTSKYNANFIPQYIDVIPAGNFFTDDEETAKKLLAQTVIFDNTGFTIFAKSAPEVGITLRIGGEA